MSSEEQSGGAMKERHFRVCELNGKKVTSWKCYFKT